MDLNSITFSSEWNKLNHDMYLPLYELKAFQFR
jgi:hypothetical protein